MWKPFTEEEVATIWEDHQAGVPLKRIARTLGRENSAVRKYVGRTGGIRPRPRVVSELRLSQSEREEISRGLAAGWSFREIAWA
jgi:IS30 family transposase